MPIEYVGRIHSTALSAADYFQRNVPTANCVINIKYPRRSPRTSAERSANNHGMDQWWVLVKEL